MIKSKIILICDKCGVETSDLSEEISTNPEWYVVGVSQHFMSEFGWFLDPSTEKVLCNKCNN